MQAGERLAYLLGIVVAVVGWQVDQVNARLQEGRPVLYSIDDSEPRLRTAHLHNLSLSKGLNEVKFKFECPEAKHCLVKDQSRLVVHSPTAVEDAFTKSRLAYQGPLSIPANGKVSIEVSLSSDIEPVFYLVPVEAEDQRDIFMLNANSLRGVATKYYFEFLVFGLVLLICGFIGLMGVSLVPKREFKPQSISSTRVALMRRGRTRGK